MTTVTADRMNELLSLLAKIYSEATGLELLRMTVNRPAMWDAEERILRGCKNGMDWWDWWKHGSWREIKRLDEKIHVLLNTDTELNELFESVLDKDESDDSQ